MPADLCLIDPRILTRNPVTREKCVASLNQFKGQAKPWNTVRSDAGVAGGACSQARTRLRSGFPCLVAIYREFVGFSFTRRTLKGCVSAVSGHCSHGIPSEANREMLA